MSSPSTTTPPSSPPKLLIPAVAAVVCTAPVTNFKDGDAERAALKKIGLAVDWAAVVEGLCGQIRDKIQDKIHPEVYAAIVGTGFRFSTTTAVECTAVHIALMDMCQSYFEYQVGSSCGFPMIILEGSPADWERLRESVEAQFDFD